ncbi:MAG: hypothetical protein HYT27_00670 [Parcubacteria group bacterium]|nr:hypothetical protein [Parcubacteria group bacterium]
MKFWKGFVGAIFALALPVFGFLHLLGAIAIPRFTTERTLPLATTPVELFYFLLFMLCWVGISMLSSDDLGK